MILLKSIIFVCVVVYGSCNDGEKDNSPITDQPSDTENATLSSTGSPTSSTVVSSTEATSAPSTAGDRSISKTTTVGDGLSTTVAITDQPNDTTNVSLSSTGSPTSSTEEATSAQSSTEGDRSTTSKTTTVGDDSSTPVDTKNDTVITAESTPKQKTTTDHPRTTEDASTNVTDSGTTTTTEGASTTVYTDSETTTTTEITMTTEIEPESGCSSEPCRNGGTCSENPDNSLLFECTCPPGYEGIRCGTIDNCVRAKDGTLCKNGACIHSEDGSVRFCSCSVSETFWDEEQKECRSPDPPCFPNPCLNGGNCSIQENGIVLCDCLSGFDGMNCSVQNKCGNCSMGACVFDDSRTTKYCKCNKGLYWNEERKDCEAVSLPCIPNPCENGGICVPTSEDTFNCSCTQGFSGTTCEVVDKCTANEDCGHGACILSDDDRVRICQCEKGFYLDEQFHRCEEIIEPCRPNPCLHDGICLSLSKNTFNCTCSEGYTGATCNVRDMCKMDGGEAFCDEAACDTVRELDVYFCTCNNSQYFDYLQRKCLDLDLCPVIRCDSTEKCVGGKCECKEHYQRKNSTEMCKPIFCHSKPCPGVDMICEEGSDETNYKCTCKEGYAFNGTHCNAASCAFPSLNSCGQICNIQKDGYECKCEKRFELNKDNHTCTYTGNDTCSNKTCDKGVCILDKETENCTCPNGYTEVNGKCVDVCTSQRMKAGFCPNECEGGMENGFRCKCEGKYALSKDKTTCTVRNVCQQNEIGWTTCSGRNAACVQDWKMENGYRCKCTDGKVETAGGICRDACSIEANQRECSTKRAVCDADEDGNVNCKCPPYFQMNSNTGICNKPADYSLVATMPLDPTTYEMESRKKRSLELSLDLRKILKDVTAMSENMFNGFSQANILACKEESDYILCKVELQFSKVQVADLKRLKIERACLAAADSDKCILPPSLVLRKDRIIKSVDFKPTDPCDADISEELCGSETTCYSSPNSTRHFNCSCKAGFSPRMKMYPFESTRSFIENCKDVDECATSDPCQTNSVCLNTIGSFSCSCKPGFRSVKDSNGEKCVGICSPNPCTHGECSSRGDHEFDCTCEAGYRGALCNLQDKNFKRARNNTVIVGVVLGGILLITFILFAVCITRIRKKKFLEDPGHMYCNSAEMTERRRIEGGAVNNAYQRE